MFRVLALAVVGGLCAQPALAAPDGQAVLAKVDAAANRAKDITATLKLTISEPGGSRAERTLQLWQKGEDRRMAKFTAPARVKGVGLLAKGDDAVYLYLPAFGRVRRVVGRNRGDSFFGTDFTQDDMARITYSERFTAKLLEDGAEHWTLRLDPRNPGDEPHHHLVLRVRKSDHVVASLTAHDTVDGKPVRTITATDVKTVGTQALAHRIEARDEQTGRTTLALLEDVATDTGLEDGFFSKRHLERSR